MTLQMPPTLPAVSSTLHAILQLDDAIQIFGVCASVIGTGCTLYALFEFLRARSHATGALRLIVDAHITGQAAIMLVQLGFLLINVAVMTLPPLPIVMYSAGDEGAWIIGVILFRKLVRLSMIVILAAASVYRVWSFYRIAAQVNDPVLNKMHYHRRSTDTNGA